MCLEFFSDDCEAYNVEAEEEKCELYTEFTLEDDAGGSAAVKLTPQQMQEVTPRNIHNALFMVTS